ncbi:MAG: hypothetical protein KatS3mg002_1146 [Candidatus Woesearchaeota archaeon]|nr:MAG: hypothetical protein KatS3mg002_1146 [Candidatus Woesearchaeota archaeon]
MYGFYGRRPMRFERIIGFIIFVMGLFSISKLVGILDSEALIGMDYMIWFLTFVCLIGGFVVMTIRYDNI